MKKFVWCFALCFLASLSMVHADKKEGVLARGYCGDGVVNGNEDCDGSDINIRTCKVMNGGEGEVKCQPNCVYDISACLTTPNANAGRPSGNPLCGNGIIEGDEQCDRDNIPSRKCTAYNGIYGEIGCTQDCKLDISRCMTPEVDNRIGGIAEVCKCTCNNDNCNGGCNPISNLEGRSECLFRCDNNCTCRCEGKTENHLEYVNIACQCDVDKQGNPQCACNVDELESLNVIVPNIAELSGRRARFPLSDTCDAR